FHFVFIPAQSQTLFFSDRIERSVTEHFFNALHFLHALTNRVEIGKHSTQPTFCNERHVDTLSAFHHDIFRLFFCTNEKNLFTASCNLLKRCCSFLQRLSCFVQVNDVNTFLLSEDVRQHLGIPLLFQVTKMYTCLEELLLKGSI